MTGFPADSGLFNRRYSAKIRMGLISGETVAMGINRNLFIETESRPFISVDAPGLQIAPIRANLGTDWDSIIVFNGADSTDTVEIFWSPYFNRANEDTFELKLFRKFLIWYLPVEKIILDSGEKEYIYFKKPFDYFGPEGYIVLIGRSESSFCDLGSSSGKQTD